MNILKRAVFAIFLLLAFSFISPSCLAEIGLEVSEEGACMVAPHTYTVNVTNRQKAEEIFYVKTSGEYSKWAWVSNKLLDLEPGEDDTSSILILPPENADMGKYSFDAIVQSKTNASLKMERELCFIIFRNYSMEISDFSLQKEVYGPSEEVEASISVHNTGSKDFEEITFSMELLKDGETLKNSSTVISLETDEKKRPTISVSLEEHQSPGDYVIKYDVMARGSVFHMGSDSITVEAKENIDTERSTEGGVLGATKKIEISNIGNTRYTRNHTEKIGYPLAFLVDAKGAMSERSGMEVTYTWDLSIGPGESQVLEYRVSYWPVYIILIILIYLIYRAYLYLQVPKVRKEVMETELRKDKRIFTISLEIKNNLLGKAKDITVEDTVPSVARVIEDFETVKPSIMREEGETKLIWKLDELEGGENRVFNYKIKTLVESVDYLKLPKAKLKGKMAGRRFEQSSSEVRVEV